MVELRHNFAEYLQKTLKNVCGALDQVVDHVEKFHLDITAPRLQHNLFKVVRDGSLVENSRTWSHGGGA